MAMIIPALIILFYLVAFVFSVIFLIVKINERLKEKKEEAPKMEEYKKY